MAIRADRWVLVSVVLVLDLEAPRRRATPRSSSDRRSCLRPGGTPTSSRPSLFLPAKVSAISEQTLRSLMPSGRPPVARQNSAACASPRVPNGFTTPSPGFDMRHAVACTRSDTPGFLRYDQITGRRLVPSGPPKKYHAVSPEKGTKGPLVFAIIWIILGSVSWTLQNDVPPPGETCSGYPCGLSESAKTRRDRISSNTLFWPL